ncbi:MAG: DUF368 domain-containing protein [Gammaproteobacteria bacterium]
MNQRIKAAAVIVLKGFCMGAADVVPGVSGGTMAFILGIYTRFVDAIKSFDAAWMKAFVRFDLTTVLTRPDFPFILPLVVGIFCAILFFTHLIPLPRLLETHPQYVYGLFFGLIIGSIVVLIKGLGGLRPVDMPPLIAGLLLGIVLVTAVPAETPDTWWFVMLCGALSICAMVVPGISGSFVLLLLGKYAYVLDAVGHFRMAVVAPFALGALAGLFSFTRLLSWLLHRHERVALLAISGILLASLWVVWPFQQRRYVEIRGELKWVESSPLLPEFSGTALAVGVLAATGFVIVVAMQRVASTSVKSGDS